MAEIQKYFARVTDLFYKKDGHLLTNDIYSLVNKYFNTLKIPVESMWVVQKKETIPDEFWPGTTTPSLLSGGFWGGVEIPDGRIIFVPAGSRYVGIYDPWTDTLTPGAFVHSSTSLKFKNGFYVDGKVIFIPNSSPRIGIYDPQNDSFEWGPDIKPWQNGSFTVNSVSARLNGENIDMYPGIASGTGFVANKVVYNPITNSVNRTFTAFNQPASAWDTWHPITNVDGDLLFVPAERYGIFDQSVWDARGGSSHVATTYASVLISVVKNDYQVRSGKPILAEAWTVPEKPETGSYPIWPTPTSPVVWNGGVVWRVHPGGDGIYGTAGNFFNNYNVGVSKISDVRNLYLMFSGHPYIAPMFLDLDVTTTLEWRYPTEYSEYHQKLNIRGLSVGRATGSGATMLQTIHGVSSADMARYSAGFVRVGSTIVMPPHYGTHVLRVDGNNLTFGKEVFDAGTGQKFSGAVRARNGKVIFIPYQSPTVGLYG